MRLGRRFGPIQAAVPAWGLISLLCLVGCERDPHREVDLADVLANAELRSWRAPPENVWRFAFDPRSSPQEDARQFLSLLKYLSRATGLEFELRLAPRLGLADDLGTGVVHFAAVGAVTYLQAWARHRIVPLVRGRNAEGRAEYRAVIVTAPGSPIRSVADLRGRSFAFGDVNTAQGHLIPRAVLAEQGIEVSDLSHYEFTGSHHECARAVVTGRADAGGMQELMGSSLAAQGLLRILHTSGPYASSCIVASNSMPESVRAAVTRALLDFQPNGRDAPGLHYWDRSVMAGGFVVARDEDYAELREWSRRFGLLPAVEPEGER